MPFINVRTSLASVSEGEQLLKDLSAALADHTGKPEAYVMTLLQTSMPMTFGDIVGTRGLAFETRSLYMCRWTTSRRLQAFNIVAS